MANVLRQLRNREVDTRFRVGLGREWRSAPTGGNGFDNEGVEVAVFLSQPWVTDWAELANADDRFRHAGAGWDGAVGVVIDAAPDLGFPTRLYVRLAGCNGQWQEHLVSSDETTIDDAVFVIRGKYQTWKKVVRQELHPIKAIVLGDLRVRGQLSAILRWSESIVLMAELAGRMETAFPDGDDR